MLYLHVDYFHPSLSAFYIHSSFSGLIITTFRASVVVSPSPARGIGHFLLLFLVPSCSSPLSELRAIVGLREGHGKICGAPTTMKDIRAVVENSDVVRNERGG